MTLITQFVHASHPGHVLNLWSREEPYECNACKEPGFGMRYACSRRRCNFHLHAKCAHAPLRASHELFPDCIFFLRPALRNCSRVCDVCGRFVHGISYRCSHRNVLGVHDVHPCCLAGPRVVAGHGGIQMRLSRNAPWECYWCGRWEVANTVRGFSFVSSCGSYCYHVACYVACRRTNRAIGEIFY